MAVDNKDFLLMSVFFTVLLALGFMAMGTELNSERTLDDQSKDYLTDFANYTSANGIDDLDNTLDELDKDSNPLLDKVGQVPIVSDILGAINFYKEKTAFVWTFVKMVFNVPTFLISSLGLPVGAFAVYLNVIGGILFIGVLYMLIKAVK